jgi:hypothetical protein
MTPFTDFSENQSHQCFYYYWQLPKVSCMSINKCTRYPGDNILWNKFNYRVSPPLKKVIPLTDFLENQSHAPFYYYWQLPKVSCISINNCRHYPGDNILWHMDGLTARRTDGQMGQKHYTHTTSLRGVYLQSYWYKENYSNAIISYLETIMSIQWLILNEKKNPTNYQPHFQILAIVPFHFDTPC